MEEKSAKNLNTTARTTPSIPHADTMTRARRQPANDGAYRMSSTHRCLSQAAPTSHGDCTTSPAGCLVRVESRNCQINQNGCHFASAQR